MLTITKRTDNMTATLALAGRLDTNTAGELEKELAGITDSASLLVLDLEKLDYISSSGLRVLLAAYKAMAKHGEMKLTHVRQEVLEVLEITGFSDFLTIE